MTLSETALDRLADVVELQPTKNADLQERWEMDSGSEVHQFLESELGEYYYRNDNSLICATPEGEALVGGDTDTSGPRVVGGTTLQQQILDVLPAPDADPQSVVSTLHDLEERGLDTTVDEVRSTLHTLVDMGLVERDRTTVPTFRLALDRSDIVVETDG